MDHPTWTVKNLKGKKLGSIKKLIIDPAVRQIAYADIVVADGHQTVRIPWRLLAINKHGILLKATREELAKALSPDHSMTIPDAIALEVTMASKETPEERQARRSFLYLGIPSPAIATSDLDGGSTG